MKATFLIVGMLTLLVPGSLHAFGNPQSIAQFIRPVLNPQPLPPKESLQSQRINPADRVTLNPQPLPPKARWNNYFKKGQAGALNPQPLPPR